MVRIKTGKFSNMTAQGIHLYRPTKRQISDAKEEAENKGFKTIWVHKRLKKVI